MAIIYFRESARRASILAACVLVPFGALAADLRTESFEPEPIRVTVDELPEPYATDSADQHPKVVPVPDEPVLKAPPGFRVNLFAEVPQARWLAVTPDGRVLCVSARANAIYLLPDEDGDGVADGRETFGDEHRSDLDLRGGMLPFIAKANGRVYRVTYEG